MKFGRGLVLALAAGAAILWAPPEVPAEESGSFSLIATYVRDYTTLEHAEGTVFGGTLQGTSTVLTSSGGPFVEGEHSLVTCLVYGKRSASGADLETACTVTSATGDKFYLLAERSAGDVKAGSGGPGQLEFVGGTGAYANLRGSCAYDTAYLANDQVVTTADCTWRME